MLSAWIATLRLLLAAVVVLCVAGVEAVVAAGKRRYYPALISKPRRVAVIGGGIAGCAAAFALRESGVDVDLFEAGAVVGGNARVHEWRDGYRSGLSVLAWPAAYFRNYKVVLRRLKIPVVPVELPFFVARRDGAFFAHGAPTGGMHAQYASDVACWTRMVRHVRAVNLALASAGPLPSLYAASLLNPFNVISLRLLARVYGCGSDAFWREVIVPLYASSFLTTSLDGIPAVVVPILHDMIPLDASDSVHMESWARPAGSTEVFQGLLQGVCVHVNAPVTRVLRDSKTGQWRVVTVGGVISDNVVFDALVFACGAHAAANALRGDLNWAPAAVLLDSVSYCGGPAFQTGVIHSYPDILPAEHREVLQRKYANYIVTHGNGRDGRYENTFILSSWLPGASAKPRFVTYDARDPAGLDGHAQGHVTNEANHPHLNLSNLALASVLRAVQGRQAVFFAGSFITPGNGHDFSLCSGFAVVHALGARYPFSSDPDCLEAAADFARLRRLMGL